MGRVSVESINHSPRDHVGRVSVKYSLLWIPTQVLHMWNTTYLTHFHRFESNPCEKTPSFWSQACMFVKRFRGWRTWAPYPHSFPFILSYSTCNGSNCTHKQITCSRQQTYLIKSTKKRFCKYFSKLSANNISECLNLMKSMIVSLTIFYCRLQHIKACIDV